MDIKKLFKLRTLDTKESNRIFSECTKMSLVHENRNIDAPHKNIAVLQNELTEKIKITKSIMETQIVVLDVIMEYSGTAHSETSITKQQA